MICDSAMLDWDVKGRKTNQQSPLAHLISSSQYCLPGPVCAADSSVGSIATGGSTVHVVNGAVQHIGYCID
jgi:hypothetical protein